MSLPATIDDALGALREAFNDHGYHKVNLQYFNDPDGHDMHVEEEDGNTIVSFAGNRWLKVECKTLSGSEGFSVYQIWEHSHFQPEPVWHQRRDDAIRVMLEHNHSTAWDRLYSCIVDAISFQGKGGRAL